MVQETNEKYSLRWQHKQRSRTRTRLSTHSAFTMKYAGDVFTLSIGCHAAHIVNENSPPAAVNRRDSGAHKQMATRGGHFVCLIRFHSRHEDWLALEANRYWAQPRFCALSSSEPNLSVRFISWSRNHNVKSVHRICKVICGQFHLYTRLVDTQTMLIDFLRCDMTTRFNSMHSITMRSISFQHYTAVVTSTRNERSMLRQCFVLPMRMCWSLTASYKFVCKYCSVLCTHAITVMMKVVDTHTVTRHTLWFIWTQSRCVNDTLIHDAVRFIPATTHIQVRSFSER